MRWSIPETYDNRVGFIYDQARQQGAGSTRGTEQKLFFSASCSCLDTRPSILDDWYGMTEESWYRACCNMPWHQASRIYNACKAWFWLLSLVLFIEAQKDSNNLYSA